MIADPAQIAVPLPAPAQSEGAQAASLTSETHRPSPADAMLRKKEQKDAELDRKIEALRKKNEALMKRYQEVEEDKKRAEQEGMALQGRKGKAEDLTITINKCANEGRVVTKKPGTGSQPAPRPAPEPMDGDSNPFGAAQGKRRQLLVTTGGSTKGRRIVSERKGAGPHSGPGGPREPGKAEEDSGMGSGRPPQSLKGETRTQEDAGKQEPHGSTEAEHNPYYQDCQDSGRQVHTDLTVPTSKEEQLEYLRWKKERERIDRERVERHKNAKGQWRRAWDMDKPETGFRERVHGEADRGSQGRGGRNVRRGSLRPYAESRGHRTRDRGTKNLQAIGSKAKGKDRLTGRARRWDAKEEAKDPQTPESFEEFLEELDAYGDADVEETHPGAESGDGTTGDKTRDTVGAVGTVTEDGSGGVKDATGLDQDSESALRKGQEEQGHKPATPEALPQREKKVRFSVEALKASEWSDEEIPEPTLPEAQADGLDRALQRTDSPPGGVDTPGLKGDRTSGRPEQKKGVCLPETPRTGTSDSKPGNVVTGKVDPVSQSVDGDSPTAQPTGHSKGSASKSPGERIDAGFSVMTTDCEAPHRAHKSNTEKAKENGKIV
ncbi:coiled-coil domain-containing protein 9B isoform X1 [Paramormyrops kingsleyae]|uniref:coiled-coil domain-containing protein 9B isoform X1 n=1 Tax=Paramormyrops kingsleyae TaxID=1676925 RepID=UPI003B96F07A